MLGVDNYHILSYSRGLEGGSRSTEGIPIAGKYLTLHSSY